MTIPATASEISYAGDGVSLALPIPFIFDTASDLKVTTTTAGVITEITTGFSVSGGNGSTGTLTFVVAPAIGTTVSIFDDPDITQTTDYVDNDAFPAESHERALDRLTRIVKRAAQRITRAIRYPDGDPYSDGVLPDVSSRKGKLLGFNATSGEAELVVSIPTTGLTPTLFGDFYKLTSVGGTANAITASLSGLLAYSRELALVVTPLGNNTTAATINVNGFGNLAITTLGGAALVGGELRTGVPAMLLVYPTLASAVLLNPQAISQTFFDALLSTSASFARTAAEIAASVTPTSYVYQPGDLRRYGGDPTGVADSSTALQSAASAGLVIIPAQCSFKIVTPATKTGTLTMYGFGPTSKLLCDSTVLTLTSGAGSYVGNFYMENITAPWIITRDPSNWSAVISGTLQQSNSVLGYQPTVNDADIWASLTMAQQNQQIGPTLTLSGDDMLVEGITGRFVRIDVTGNRCMVKNCNIRGGKGIFGSIIFNNGGVAAGSFNQAINNHVRYSSFSGITFMNQTDGLMQGNTCERCGESGLKTYQGVGFSCVNMRIIGNTANRNYYDGLDTASRFPLDDTQDTKHKVIGNDAFGNRGNGINGDGLYNIYADNACSNNTARGIWCLGSRCKIQGNFLVSNNLGNDAGAPHILGGGTLNDISDNRIFCDNSTSNAIFADGTNFIHNNRAVGSSFFFGNPGAITSVMEGNVDDTTGFATEQSFLLVLANNGANIQHSFNADGTGTAGRFSSRVLNATSGLVNTPTATDSSTAMANGGKISSAATNRFILDTAVQSSANFQGIAQVVNQTVGTALDCEVITNSRNVNGVTRVRIELIITNRGTGAAFNLASGIGAGQAIRIQFVGRIA